MFMILFPLGTFYFLYYIVFEKNKDMLGWCGIAAVVAANIVIFAYVWMAWNEDNDEIADRKAYQQKHSNNTINNKSNNSINNKLRVD